MSTTYPSNSSRNIRRPDSLGGTLAVPGDKSISHRSLILNVISYGDAFVQGLSYCYDVFSTMHCLQAMGVDIEPTGQTGSYRINPIDEPKNPIIKLIRYKRAMPPVAATIINRKFSVGLIQPLL